MPWKPIDYSNTIFYKIVCKDVGIADCYVGHTTNFARRKNFHKTACLGRSERFNYYVYQFVRENGGWDNWDMVLIEKRACEDFLHACKVERQHIEHLNATLNKYIPARDRQEYAKQYTEKNKERIALNKKKYFERNKERIQDYQRKYREDHKEEVSAYNKQYRKAHTKEHQEESQRYYQRHRSEISERTKITYTCECGSTLRRADKSKHEKTKKHQKFLSLLA